MIVQRWTFNKIPDKFDEALEVAKKGRKSVWPAVPTRIYSFRSSSVCEIVVDFEFNDEVELIMMWGEVWATEEWKSWHDKWVASHADPEPKRHVEVWNLVE